LSVRFSSYNFQTSWSTARVFVLNCLPLIVVNKRGHVPKSVTASPQVPLYPICPNWPNWWPKEKPRKKTLRQYLFECVPIQNNCNFPISIFSIVRPYRTRKSIFGIFAGSSHARLYYVEDDTEKQVLNVDSCSMVHIDVLQSTIDQSMFLDEISKVRKEMVPKMSDNEFTKKNLDKN